MDRTMGIGANMGGIGMADEAKMEKLKMDKEEMKAMIDSMDETQMSSMMEMMGKMGMMGGEDVAEEETPLAWTDEPAAAGKKLARMGAL